MKVVVPGNKTLIIPANSATTVAGAASNVSIVPKIEPDIQANSTVDGGSSTATSTNLQFQTPNNPVNNSSSLSGANKRPASLDLKSTTKKPRLVAPSPLQMDHPVNTPEVEKLILSNNLIQTPKPGVVFPQKHGQITTEQEEFGKGFEEALNNIHKQNIAGSTIATTGACMSGGAFTYTKLDNIQVAIKDEPPNPPASPGNVQPIDMETQEQIKLERKRQRNRVAASKCRKRKLERISKLEDKVKDLKNENTDLSLLIKTLKDNVAKLKQEVVEHVNFGCEISMCHLIQAK